MKQTARVSVWVAAACGLLLAAGGPSFAQARAEPFGEDGIYGSETFIDVTAGFSCSQRAAACINGPVNSGNVSHAQNVHIGGNGNHAGSPENINGNTNSHNESHGASSKTDDDLQTIGPANNQHL